MNILIIDDQKNVVDGLQHGVHWDQLPIEKIQVAYNSTDALQIIKDENIDLMLCDIEMPGGNGLYLFREAKKIRPSIECIFLTAHANFDFAHEALKLGSFDYILQPAPYKVIEEAILKNCSKISIDQNTKQLSIYGKEMLNNKNIYIDSLFINYIDHSFEEKKFIDSLQKVSINVSESTSVCFAMLSILKWNGKPLENELMRYIFQNIYSELLEGFCINVVIGEISSSKYMFMLYTNDNYVPNNELENFSNILISKCNKYYGCSIALYLGHFSRISTARTQIDDIQKMDIDNVSQKACAFHTKQHVFQVHSIDMTNWAQQLIGGKASHVRIAALNYLSFQDLNSSDLKTFYMDYMQVLASATNQINQSVVQIWGNREAYEKQLVAYHYTSDMKSLVEKTTNYFIILYENNGSNYVELIIQYIRKNIDKDIRRDELASYIGLNEDYLSRIFKQEKGISLKEYITEEKMQVAKNLLRNTNFSISSISIKVGYTNFSYFSQTYKKVMKISPAEERKVLLIS